jgi:hypothetical protein
VAGTIQVKGIRDLLRAFQAYDAALLKKLREELRDTGRLVQADAYSRFSSVSPKSAAGFKVRVRQRGVSVEQSLRRTTGLHPEFGSLQMRKALLPALESKQPLVMERLELMLDRLESSTF